MKRLLLSILLAVTAFCAKAQQPDWQHKDLEKDKVFGCSVDKAYRELLAKKKGVRVLVAVIDGGVDTAHEDLKGMLWRNKGEITSNGKDDDHNGYVDDLFGWNFIGGASGNVHYDNLEMTRLVRDQQKFYDSVSRGTVPEKFQQSLQAYTIMANAFTEQRNKARSAFDGISKFKTTLEKIVLKVGKDSITLVGMQQYRPEGEYESKVTNVLISQLKKNPDFATFKKNQVDGVYDYYYSQLYYYLNPDFDPRPIVGDNYADNTERHYGNSNVCGPQADHGSHVAGIIAAVRNNATGMNGIADKVQILSLRVVPQGDERDKDVANAIRYAVDKGATIINMSFGKSYSPQKQVVDAAVKYAVSKDVLLIHAAGNDGKDLDAEDNFPNKAYADNSGTAASWIEVGASGPKDDSTLAADFSNYGKTKVDLFAPGVQIYSTTPGSTYASFNGTSMAAPVVCGVAALIREYYPRLTAVQVKEILMKSVIKRPVLTDKCISGGVVNAYQALQLAASYK